MGADCEVVESPELFKESCALKMSGQYLFDPLKFLSALPVRFEIFEDTRVVDIDPKKKINDMSVSEKQTVEIIKVLYRGADILILDEPTAVLTPQETEKLFSVLRRMRDDGKSILIITHKHHEVLSVSDRVTI